MTLALRLLVAFGVVAIFAAALVGLSMRDASREIIEADFQDRIDMAAAGVRQELAHEAEALRGLLAPLCAHDTFVDKAHVDLETAKGNPAALDPGSLIAIRHFVPDQARAIQLDELVLVTGDGMVLGASDVARIGTKDSRLAALIKTPAGAPRLRPGGLSAPSATPGRAAVTPAPSGGKPAAAPPSAARGGDALMEVHCARSSGGVTIGLVGARRIAPILERVGNAYGVRLDPVDPSRSAATSGADEVVRPIDFPEVVGLRVTGSLSKGRLKGALAKLDQAILVTGAAALGIAIAIAVILARSLSRPIVALARETREVVSGEPRNVRGRGGREIAELAESFNRTINELTAMRKRLAATERIAARREVARQVAHEIKNPLAPIRAAVETLRRLRAREDPAFDEYFDEATRTVLEEVHRIANIVTEFTNFSRLPPPNPEPIDLAAVARGVVRLHDASPGEEGQKAGAPRVELVTEPIPEVLADRDQMVQVLTNLVQNGIDAASAVREDPRVVVTVGPLPNHRVRVVVRDNGPGVSEAMLARLFEPYATSKEKGTGLGLAIVQRIVFEHGGEITYRAATKGGAVFEIWLPVAGPPLLEKPPSVEATAPRH